MNIYLIALLGLFAFFIFYCHIYQYIKTNNQYQILQVSNPKPDILEKYFLEKLPIVITDLVEQWDGFNQIDHEYMKVQPDLSKDKVVVKLLDQYSGNYHVPFRVSKKYQSVQYKKNQQIPFTKVKGNRHMIVQLEGKMRYLLFHPGHTKNIYNGKIDYWNWHKYKKEDQDKYPNFKKAGYVELYLNKGKILHLPKGWWFVGQSLDDSIQVSIDSESIFSFMI